MKSARWLSVLAAMVAGASAMAQLPVETDLFGDDLSKAAGQSHGMKSSSDYRQTLFLQNGAHLRGELLAVTKDEILWHRRDASEPLRISKGDVRGVLLVPPDAISDLSSETSESKPRDPKALTTIKLAGDDWLRGVLTSPDGETFAMTLQDGAPLQVSRTQIEWLSFGLNPDPAAGLGAGPLALEGWMLRGAPRVEWKDGALTIHDAEWIGRQLAKPDRFEVAFEIPAESEEGLRLWLQPWSPQPQSYGTGTIEFRFGRKSLKWLIYYDDINPADVPFSAEMRAEAGPVQYRIFYDNPAQHVILLRNGRQLGDWSLKPKKRPDGIELILPNPCSLCLDREESDENGKKGPLQFRHLSVLPWDGVLPDRTPIPEDRLSTAAAKPVHGRLEKLGEKELTFAGQTTPLAPGTFIKFPLPLAPPAKSEAFLSLGEQGQLGITGLQMSEGRIRGGTSFTPALDLAATTGQFIAFAPQKETPLHERNLLVFRNGDALPGTLVTASTGALLRWRLATGQEVDFQTDRIAGVRLQSAAKLVPTGAIELRDGECLRGTLMSLDDRQLRWSHTLLGQLAVDRDRLWRVSPRIRPSLTDIGSDPEGWLSDTPKVKSLSFDDRAIPRSRAWLAFDGRFLQRTRDFRVGGSNSDGEQILGPFCEIGGEIDRFELRVDVVFPSGLNQDDLNVSFFASDEAGIEVGLASEAMQINAQNPNSPNGGTYRQLPLQDQIGESDRAFCLRAFVDRPAGTIELFLNGLSVGRTGQITGDRMPGVGKSISIDANTQGGNPLILSQVTITPWSGEVPRPGAHTPVTILANGDVVPATGPASLPASLTNGRWRVESDLGPLDLPVERVQAVEFGGEMQPVAAAGRLRLVDGSALLVDRFAWTRDQLTAHHALFGDLKLPANAVTELIFNPAPIRPATTEAPRKPTPKHDAPPQILAR